MQMQRPIIFIENPTEDDHAIIINGINEYAAQFDLDNTNPYFFVIKNENSEVIAAISGFNNFGPTEIGGLWVDEKFRGQGYGKALVEAAAARAKDTGSSALTVFTLKNWPVCAWYQRLGFRIEYERNGHANGGVGCYLIKQL